MIAAPSWAPSFYKKYIDAAGIPILSSSKVSDDNLKLTRKLILILLKKRTDIHRELVSNNLIIVIRSKSEKNSDHPDFSGLKGGDQDEDSGLAGDLFASSTTLIAEDENGNVYINVIVHEMAHVVHHLGIATLEGSPKLNEINKLQKDAINRRLFVNSDHLNDLDKSIQIDEFFAMVTEVFFNATSHEEYIYKNRDDIKKKHPNMYKFLIQYFPAINILDYSKK